MRKLIVILALALTALALVAAAGQMRAARTSHAFAGQAPSPAAAPVDVTVQVGTLRVEGWDEPRVEVAARVDCGPFAGSRCREIADALRLRVAPNASGRIVVRLDGWPRSTNHGLRAEVTVRMPRGAPLDVLVGVGKAELSGLEGSLSADIGVGRAQIEMPERAVALIDLETGVGAASLHTASGDHETRAPFGAELDWRGKGKSRVSVSCGVGRVRVGLG